MIRQRLPQKETLDKSQPRDLFQTPNYAVDLLSPFIPIKIRSWWEPAAGEGKIVDRLEYLGHRIYRRSDIRLPNKNIILNFLTDIPEYLSEDIGIITNPPFSLKQKFFKKCIEYNLPFALLISSDYSLWTINAIRNYGCEKIVPDHRIDYITPTGLSGATGHTSYFHSMWLTRYFSIGKTETFVELTKKMKENI